MGKGNLIVDSKKRILFVVKFPFLNVQKNGIVIFKLFIKFEIKLH